MKIANILKPNRKWLVASVLIVSACAGAISTQPGEQTVEEAQAPTADVSAPESNDVTDPAAAASIPKVLPDLLPDEPPPLGAEGQFSTDFTKHTIPYTDVLSGGPPKDGIPAIDDPSFISVAEADEFLGELEPVIYFQIGDDARAYPLQILTWHEIVNDVVGEQTGNGDLLPALQHCYCILIAISKI